ncbi:unnamed protein product, partial [marine sediment metagenome]
SGSERLLESPLNIAQEIKRRIKKELDITATVSIAKSKTVAKIAAEQVKKTVKQFKKIQYSANMVTPFN